MGTKGAGGSEAAAEQVERLTDDLASLGDVTTKKMFGGYGVFESGVMFALVDRAGVAHLRADDTTAERYAEAGATKHGGMPYWSIPEAVDTDDDLLIEWATEALSVAREAKSKPKRTREKR